MKWFLALVVGLNILVAVYGVERQHAPGDVHAQEVNPGQLKLLPADWQPSAPVPDANGLLMPTASAPAPALPASAPAVRQPASAPTVPAKLPRHVKKSVASSAQASLPEPRLSCVQWGGLGNNALAHVRAGLSELKLGPDQLAQRSVALSPNAIQNNLRYWVYYPQAAKGAANPALSDGLKSKGFDNYLVQNDGQFHGALSLGLYSSQVSANALVARLKAAGYDKAAIDPRGAKENTLLVFKALSAHQAQALAALQQRLTPGIALKAVSCIK
jgi:hypothetical protein